MTIKKKIKEDKTNAQFQIKFGLSSGSRAIKNMDNTGITSISTKRIEKILPESIILLLAPWTFKLESSISLR